MIFGLVFVLFINYFISSVDFVLVQAQGLGSGNKGNLRLCIVEGRGSYKRGSRYCPILDEEHAPVECVIGADRLDCLRRISKGTVDFGAFSPEDLVAAQWAQVDVLVTNQLRLRDRPFAGSIIALVNSRILPAYVTSVTALLRNRTLCQPAVDVDDLRPLSETLARYLESQVTARSCDPKLSLTENRVRSTAEFFGPSCKAGPWLPDKGRDEQLKMAYPSLCAACATPSCDTSDPYWGVSGALNCMAGGVGDVAWAELDDVIRYFQTNPSDESFSYLCRDGSWQSTANNSQPCVWLHRPWPVIVAKRKVASVVANLTSSLTNSTVTTDQHWYGALAALLEAHQELPEPLQPPLPPMDYLATASGFREAYSQHGCDPPRHITLCTTSILEQNKCSWLAEAGAVYGVTPPLQCSRALTTEGCAQAVSQGDADAVMLTSDWLVKAHRNYTITAILHEATPILEKTNTVFAYARKGAISKMADLRGKRAVFPRFDGFAWHSVFRYLATKEKTSCKKVVDGYFSLICAPGVQKYDVPSAVKEELTKSCYKVGEYVLEGETQALRAVVDGKADVAFISMNTYNMYRNQLIQEPWATKQVELSPICPEDNPKYCFVSWANLGHLFVRDNLTEIRHHEIVNVFTKLDQLFGKNHVHKLMFSMYGTFNHQLDVLFHNNTRALLTNEMYNMRPFNEIPFSFERSLNQTCQFEEFMKGFAVKCVPANLFIVMISLVLALLR